MITELTKEQEALMPAYAEKWLKIGLSTEPLDFDKAKDAAIRAYQVAGLPPPTHFYRASSPVGAALMAAVLTQIGNQVGEQVTGQLDDQVRRQVSDQLRALVWLQVTDQVGEQVEDQVLDPVRRQVWDQVSGQIADQVGRKVLDQVWNNVWDQVRRQVSGQVSGQLRLQVWNAPEQLRGAVRDQIWGYHDAGWLSFYDFMASVLGITDAERLRPLMDLAQVCGWWAPYKNAVILQDRANVLRRDEQNRLHCEDGPAVAYPDGVSMYFWHGISVPAHWITDKANLKASEVLKEENVEKRRAGCEILGWDHILRELNAVEVDVNPNPQIGTLLEVELPDAGKERFIRVQCGTGRIFALPVPPEMRTALEAQKWMWNDKEYNPEIRT